ncbi:MAG: VCBS repeat-containing protein [Deltaproteobacteria bacterium]|nr:VCBS repeat-containing protein [Deltaproteobacteria bacterium]
MVGRRSLVALALVLLFGCASGGRNTDADAGGEDPASDVDAASDTVIDEVGEPVEDPAAEDVVEDEGPSDRDGDTVPDDEDAFPDDPAEWLDTDGDGTGDNADTDDDGDTIPDDEEAVHGDDCRISSSILVDTDGDGIDDPDDPYPRDQWPEFVINSNEIGTFYFYLSNRDGTFMPRVEWGTDIGDNYGGFTIADFSGDGKMDFIGHSTTADTSGNYDLYYFYRTSRMDVFIQILVGSWEEHITGTVADVNDDTLIDIVDFKRVRPPGEYIATVTADTYLNNGNIMTATCVAADAPSTSCAFTRVAAYDLTYLFAGQWEFLQAYQAVDVTGDGIKDLVVAHYASGGNTPVPVYVLTGVGDGTFVSPTIIFTHNASRTQAPANSIVFADFTSDDIGDVILGLDDDGDPGQAWIYYGLSTGSFSSTGVETFDTNPSTESGSDEPGGTTSARCFDFDFDGDMDIMVGYSLTMSDPLQSRFDVLLGLGDGQFAAPIRVGPVLDDLMGHRFAIPTRLCPWYGP